MKTITFLTASWCPFCKRLAPQVDKLAADRGWQVDYVDVDSDRSKLDELGVTSIPVVIVGDQHLVNPNILQVKSLLDQE